MLTSALDLTRYAPRTYIISEGDTLSAKKAIALESHLKAAEATSVAVSLCHTSAALSRRFSLSRSQNWPQGQQDYRILRIPRARRVHQSLLTVLPTFMHSLLACIHLVTISPLLGRSTFGAPFVDLVILNGPGTCVTLCAAIMLNKVSSRFSTELAIFNAFNCNDFDQLIGLPSPKMIYVESFARVQSLSLSGRILRHVVDRYVLKVKPSQPHADFSVVLSSSGLVCCQPMVARSTMGVLFDGGISFCRSNG
jgi:beta-1,4-N-acetylglucosaminyltransferase